jgi:hypothetical protein
MAAKIGRKRQKCEKSVKGDEKMEIKEILEEQLEILYNRCQRNANLEEICVLNKEIRETARLIIEIENAELSNENTKAMLQMLKTKEKEN